MTVLEVWGDPIAHSRSPILHAAAYAHLGLDWTYGRRQVNEQSFAGEFASARGTIRGLSLTMPLKELAFDTAGERDARALRTGAVNTLLLAGLDEPKGFNTDIGGFLGALADNGVTEVATARVIGAGATAASAVVALAEAGAGQIEIVARTPQRAASLVALASELGVTASVRALADSASLAPVDATIATLPGGTEIDPDAVAALASASGPLVDAVYAPWPTQCARAWEANGLPASSGLAMLLHQAVLQVRVFVTGEVIAPLDREGAMMDAMRSALMGD